MEKQKLINNVWLTGIGAYQVAPERGWTVQEDDSIMTEKGPLWVDQGNQIMLGDRMLIPRQGNIHKREQAAAKQRFLQAYEEA